MLIRLSIGCVISTKVVPQKSAHKVPNKAKLG